MTCSKNDAPPAPRSALLDALRGVAILLVLGCHYAIPPAEAGALSVFARGWAHVGWSGVDLFFVLSGFLVSGLLFAEFSRNGTVDLKRFAVRRVFKIWPPYAVYLCVVLAWLTYKMGMPEALSRLWPNFLHFQNYFDTPRFHTWSLAVEEHFYLLAALGTAWLVHRGRECAASLVVPGVLLLGVAAICAARYYSHLASPTSVNIYATHLRSDGLLVGTLLAYLTHFRPRALHPLAARPFLTVIVGACLAAPVLIVTPDYNSLAAGPGLTAMYVGYALVIQGLVSAQKAPWMLVSLRLPPVRCLAWIGFFSYGIYLWHVEFGQTPLKKLVEAQAAFFETPVGWTLGTTAYLLAAILGGAAMSKLVEFPALRVRDRLFPSKVHAPAAPTAPQSRNPAAAPGQPVEPALQPEPVAAQS